MLALKGRCLHKFTIASTTNTMLAKYTLHKCIGEGGYSKVYKCTDEIGIRYACKQLTKAKNTRERVTQEISVMKALHKSPKIVRFVDAGEDDDNFYIVQEWCRGGSAQEYIQRHPSYDENTVASIVRGTIRGLCHMHENGIIHRDIKAGNVLFADVSDDADVKIGDMGTALFAVTDIIEVDKLVGTPWFMAPENLRHVYHPSSDIWSAGVMTHQLLCGKLPFNDWQNPINPDLAKIWYSILYQEPSMSSLRWDNISSDAKDFVKLCLHKDFTQRQCAKELLKHPWLTNSDCSDRFKGQPLKCQPFKYENEAQMKAMTLSHELEPQ
jgi:calcium-dependent protein kinase